MGEPDSKAPSYRFPAVDETTEEFHVTLPAFPDAPHGFTGSIKQLLAGVRSQQLPLDKVPLAPLVDQYLAFREALAPAEAHERVSDFLPLAATLIHLKSELFVRKPVESGPPQPSPEEQLLEEIQRAERRRAGRPGPAHVTRPHGAAQ